MHQEISGLDLAFETFRLTRYYYIIVQTEYYNDRRLLKEQILDRHAFDARP